MFYPTGRQYDEVCWQKNAEGKVHALGHQQIHAGEDNYGLGARRTNSESSKILA
jgi:hypothetical protein